MGLDLLTNMTPAKHLPFAEDINGWIFGKLGKYFAPAIGAGVGAYSMQQALDGILSPGASLPTSASLPMSSPAASMPVTNNVSVSVTANTGANAQEIGDTVARKVDEVLDRRNREAQAALVPSWGLGKL